MSVREFDEFVNFFKTHRPRVLRAPPKLFQNPPRLNAQLENSIAFYTIPREGLSRPFQHVTTVIFFNMATI